MTRPDSQTPNPSPQLDLTLIHLLSDYCYWWRVGGLRVWSSLIGDSTESVESTGGLYPPPPTLPSSAGGLWFSTSTSNLTRYTFLPFGSTASRSPPSSLRVLPIAYCSSTPRTTRRVLLPISYIIPECPLAGCLIPSGTHYECTVQL